MIAAFAQAARVLDDPAYAEAARQAANYILTNVRDSSGRLLHTAKDGQAKLDAYLDDYAAFIDGLTELFQATGEVAWLDTALDLAAQMIERFSDPSGGFFYTSHDHEELIVRQRDSQDNATPSGNSLAATALLKLARLTGRRDLEESAVAALDSMSAQIAQSPLASGQALIALDFLLGPTKEIVLSGSEKEIAPLRRAIEASFIPNKVVLVWTKETGDGDPPDCLRDLLKGKAPRDVALAYICERGVCHAPVSDAAETRVAVAGR